MLEKLFLRFITNSNVRNKINDSDTINNMDALSHGNEDFILDHEFTEDEIHYALNHLKSNKNGGADGLVAKQLKYGGHTLILWLKRILNRIIQLESIPHVSS